MKRHRIERHESLIHQTINEYLIREGKSFLKKEFITIMGIKLSPDLSIALIYISVLNNSKSEFVEKVMYDKVGSSVSIFYCMLAGPPVLLRR